MRNILIGIVSSIVFLSSTYSTRAFDDSKVTRSVNVGSSVLIRNYYIYQLNPCRSMPTPTIDARTPTLGKVTSAIVDIKPNRGPCPPGFKYQALQVTYLSGASSGVDKFTLHIHNGYRFTPIPIEIRVGGGAQQRRVLPSPQPTVLAPVVTSTPPQGPVNRLSNVSKTLSGRYVNDIGNIVTISNGVVYFTGFWNREKVEKKPFAIKAYDGNEFEWGVYKCAGNSVEFTCSNIRREQRVVYRRF